MDDKIIVTNRGALAAKYGAKGVATIGKAVKALVAADKARGIKTRLLHLDDAAAMKKVGAKAVASVKDYRGTKVAIDRIFKKLQPDYLMILGSIDVVPHQNLANPVYKAGDDDDTKAWGDLPYACDAAYSHDPAKFVGPTRVVGRLPDLTGATEPSHLVALLKTAANWKGRKAADYAKYFGLSAAVWEGSTTLSLEAVFGDAGKLLLTPPKGPKFAAGTLGARAHFINCHGALASPEFYGEKGNQQPVCLDTKRTAGKISPGTVASVECCYGGELYDSVTLGIEIPICQSYLRQGAYGYLGSTTIAYGPPDDNGAADLICQYFLLQVLSGASIGRAALMARQQFVESTSQMDPIDLKTLAQFCLLGDPSVHPVVTDQAAGVPKGAKLHATSSFRRSERRAKMRETGEFLQRTKPTASQKVKVGKTTADARKALAGIASKGGLSPKVAFAAFRVRGGNQSKGAGAKAASAPARYYLAVGRPKPKNGQAHRVAVIAKELGGRIIDYRIYHER